MSKAEKTLEEIERIMREQREMENQDMLDDKVDEEIKDQNNSEKKVDVEMEGQDNPEEKVQAEVSKKVSNFSLAIDSDQDQDERSEDLDEDPKKLEEKNEGSVFMLITNQSLTIRTENSSLTIESCTAPGNATTFSVPPLTERLRNEATFIPIPEGLFADASQQHEMEDQDKPEDKLEDEMKDQDKPEENVDKEVSKKACDSDQDSDVDLDEDAKEENEGSVCMQITNQSVRMRAGNSSLTIKSCTAPRNAATFSVPPPTKRLKTETVVTCTPDASIQTSESSSTQPQSVVNKSNTTRERPEISTPSRAVKRPRPTSAPSEGVLRPQTRKPIKKPAANKRVTKSTKRRK